MNIPVLFEDNHVLVVEKPVNIPVQEDQSGDADMLTLLKADLKERYQKPGNVFLGLVHRLDRPVGGVMVFAKTSKAASRLSDAIRRGAFERTYLAVVRGKPVHKQAQLENTLLKDHAENKVHVVSSGHGKGKRARLTYEMLAAREALSLLSVQLETGRPHQIRVQLSHAGMPLYGDQKYGFNVNKPGQQIALWAHKLSFEHPTKKDMITVESTPPDTGPWQQFF
ncbi:23S rRNA pseudouridine(1911/1915/1917) synthase [Lentibacillus sp. JNUCC-1]|uniref:RluA family pseudouridine synthase n=1 Tax=Lentibacillus sp. JNUCC-1 TaxID=2654513 RepID=UPI0012E97A95|nr:RNA pseudouridine synthase [Lentibacillus sp. JNUCC-1]MUV38266.1 23S rRNA pseudouridine(1911/1915/1917) synthase [Lentibacillus sp. JNUCC-1]